MSALLALQVHAYHLAEIVTGATTTTPAPQLTPDVNIPALSGNSTPGAPLPDDSLSSLLAPGGALALVIATLFWTAREWRKGRETRVKDAEESEEQARMRLTAAEVDRDRATGELRQKLADVEHQLVELREEMRRMLEEQETRHRSETQAQEARHRNELAAVRSREEARNLENWRLRTLLTLEGVDPDSGRRLREALRDDEHGAADLLNGGPAPTPAPPPVPVVESDDDDGMGP